MPNQEKQNWKETFTSLILLPLVIYSMIKSAYLDEEENNAPKSKKITNNKHRYSSVDMQKQR